MKISIPSPILLLLVPLHQTHALFITSSLPTKTLSPGSSSHISSTSCLPSRPPSSIPTISAPTTQIAEATITAKPAFKPGDEVALLSLHQKWHITTYCSCATFGKDRVFCGWSVLIPFLFLLFAFLVLLVISPREAFGIKHEPVRPGGDEIAAANPGLDLGIQTKVAALAAGILAVIFAALL
ncbi:uncharacterized protein RSE6_16019 [Rhynchosporium secalis]|uniref:Uncharacterized protein n=1 Tax=Rhynchosporium secalis TaxID=38038 RepID=A0A1E1LXQ1_RHYSE|nr:uncharacterized protein RSE6_16019 [Rhynchosporium secalis]